MKTKIISLIVYPILILICNQNLIAQKIINSDSLIGEWEYFSTGDTVILINHTIDKTKDYKKWIFKTNHDFMEESSVHGEDQQKGLGVKSVGVKWYYDENTKILKINRGQRIYNYTLDSYDKNTIRLINNKK